MTSAPMLPDSPSSLNICLPELEPRVEDIDSHMNERIDQQVTRMDGAERRISEVEDGCIDMKKWLERVKHLLKTVASKNEDLEAHLCLSGGINEH
ncbi:hypothetical protein NDU88_007772 [Pleurodeles waltl]|uniref:t-SNARE coiled-coil homology domain-containing protein n=1 Tax=Pleurodeles waltl TaxID=8319 RepID=A0AAV7NCD2_PLEWA|nr:hypothetical protein NDU88_007772 [Pleurodeles waltl]